ncbi:MAG: PKD domain-containing protein, partial [Saprospiraceae bacterium]
AWSDGSTDQRRVDLAAGDYNITVTDAGGCSTVVPVTLGAGDNAPVANFDLSFDDLDGTFTNTRQNGTTYSWDFGDGASASGNDATHSFNSEGAYTICLTATNDCGSDTYCKEYTIQALNTNKSFEFDFGEVSGTVGNTIKIPVYVLNFKSIVGFQKSVHIEDPSVAKIIGITDLNLKDLSTGLFSLKEDQFTMSWFDGSIEGVDVPDSTIIYQIEVELLSDDICTGIIIKEDPLPTEVYKKVGTSEVDVAAFKRTGEICIGNGGTTDQAAKISGVITMEDGMTLSEVNLSCTNQETITNTTDGAYLFSDLTPAIYEITPTKNINPLNGVTTFDLVIIQNYILGKQKFDSPYKLIAADVNKTGTVTVSDILELRKLLLSDITDFTKNTAWRFIPTDYEFPNPENPFQEAFPESTTLTVTDKNLTADFIGVKIGDVNLTATPNNLVVAESRNTQKGFFIISTTDKYLQKGETTTLTFKGENLANLLGFQYTLKAVPSALTIEKVETYTSFTKNNIGQSLQNKGYLLTSWINEQPEKSTIPQALFTLTLKAHQTGNLSDLLSINSDFLVAEAYDKTGNHLNIQLVFDALTPANNLDFKLSQNQPNPFAQKTVINYQLPDNGQVQLNIFDIQGSLLQSIEENGQKGQNSITIHSSNLPTGGIYYYQLSTPFGIAMKKMLFVAK